MTLKEAARIIYELDRQNAMKPQGATLDEIAANIAKAQRIVMTESEKFKP